MKRSARSRQWYEKHRSDKFVRQAQADGARSRAVYKLEQIDARDALVKPGMWVLDLGAAPGGWSQYAARKVGPKGGVIAVDLLEMPPLPNVTFVQGDVCSAAIQERIQSLVPAGGIGLVLSDMAPNLSGIRSKDEAQGELLGEIVVQAADVLLKPGGSLLTKAFHGMGFEGLRSALRERFQSVSVRKPAASRAQSSEIYLVAKGHGV